MNQINSLILEGNLTSDAGYVNDKLLFTISVSRYYKDTNGEAGEVKSYFDIEVTGVLAEKLHNKLKEGRGVRVVGQLRSKDVEGNRKVYVFAEHIELKPVKGA